MKPAERRDDFGFVLAFDPGYLRMATALVHALVHFHAGHRIRVYTMAEHVDALTAWARPFREVEVVAYRPAHALSFGEWHPLVWAKLEAFAAEESACQVVLDVDQILYRSLTGCIGEALDSGKIISASPDITDLRGHVLPSFNSGEGLDALAGVPCFNAGAMIVRPSREAYRELIALARAHHADVRLPEQAVLNLWARQAGGHHDLGETFMLGPWSPRLLEPVVPSCLVHFWTPRPPFFGASPLRSSEPAWEECLRAFAAETGQGYPLERFERDFLRRLRGELAEGSARHA
ncbi:hypothetical protein [Sorangium sp. So ce1389]|uniref:hypothetical protein n=1 Tax=Sorangium sp. So ce1389 TaxID=3133336 RepID=UPI003F5F5D76